MIIHLELSRLLNYSINFIIRDRKNEKNQLKYIFDTRRNVIKYYS